MKKTTKKKTVKKYMDMESTLVFYFTYNGVKFKRVIRINRMSPDDPKERKEFLGVCDQTITKVVTWAKLNDAYSKSMAKLISNAQPKTK